MGIAKGFASGGQSQQEDNDDGPSSDNEKEKADVEINSGVKFPGQCLEPLMKAALRIAQLSLSNAQQIVVEYRDSGSDSFAFKCNKGETLQIGVCEWCNQRNILRYICKCKVIKYCNESCMEKDKNFHVPKCPANADGEL